MSARREGSWRELFAAAFDLGIGLLIALVALASLVAMFVGIWTDPRWSVTGLLALIVDFAALAFWAGARNS